MASIDHGQKVTPAQGEVEAAVPSDARERRRLETDASDRRDVHRGRGLSIRPERLKRQLVEVDVAVDFDVPSGRIAIEPRDAAGVVS